MSNVRLWAPEWDRPFVIDGRRVDPAARLIESEGGAAELEPRVMALLIILAQRQGETVRRQDLIDAVWGGAPGADQSLNNAISLLRRALSDTHENRKLIQTVPKQGYRLCALVEREGVTPATAQLAPLDSEKVAAPPRVSALSSFARYGVLAGALAAVLVILGAVASLRQQVSVPAVDTVGVDIDPLSIAVLPFANMSADPDNAYFSDGLTEEILHALSQVDSLKVAARTDSFQFRDTTASIMEVANQLHVANILEGSIRQDGETLRVTAQLISAADGAHLWSSTYDRKIADMLAIQQDIAINIADALAGEISDAERALLKTLPTQSFSAYEQYLIGNHELRKWTPEGNRRSIEFFERAVELDPEFAEARLAMGRAYYFAGTHYGWMKPGEAIPKVKASLVYGVSASNPVTRAAALSIYGDVLAWHDRDWPGAIAAYQRAYELSGTPPLGYALTDSITGNHDAAIGIFRKLLDTGAGDVGINGDLAVRNNLAWAYFNARRYDEALHEAGAVVSADAGFADGYRVLGRAQLLSGRNKEAIESFSNAVRLMESAAVAQSDLAVAFARAGQEEDARAILGGLLALDTYVPAPLIAQIYANLGDNDLAFQWLGQGIEDGARGVIFLKINPLYDPIRNDPRFPELLGRLNLESE